MFGDKRSDGFDIVAADGVDQVASLFQARSAWYAVAACEYELCVGVLGILRSDLLGMVFVEYCDRFGIATVDVAQEIFCLMPELFEVRTDRDV
jgi:hypothetical protein